MRSWELKGLNQNGISVWILLISLITNVRQIKHISVQRHCYIHCWLCTILVKFYEKHKETQGLIEGIYTLMATLRSAKHQQLMFLLKHSVSKVKKNT